MAAAVRATPRMAPPPLPSIQTSTNGMRTSTSPSMASKRPPSIPRQPSGGAPQSASAVASSGRPVRNRKETQRQSSARSVSRATTEGVDGAMARNSTPIPYVRTDEYILEKFRDCPPSLIIHLHSTYFRFDQQDGTFPYNSPMKVILEHIRAKTIPHDLLEALDQSGVKYYEGCLIVEIQDHKSSTASTSQSSADKSSLPSDKLYSVHKPSQYLTPSPYVAYPSTSTAASQSSPPIVSKVANSGDASLARPAPAGPKKYTTVLHPTALSKHREILIEATTMVPEPRSHTKKNQAAAVRDAATPSSAFPPTPLSAIPNLPSNSKSNSQKRRRMRLEGEEIYEFEAEMLRTTEPVLFLEPAESFEDCQAIMKSLTHPQHDHSPPKRAGRKRTFAELAADEAQAAEEERMALIGDTRLQPSLGITAAGQSGAIDGGDAAKQTESNFRWAKNIEDITQEHREAKARKAQEEIQKKIDEAQRAKERQLEEEREAQRERERSKREQIEKVRQAQMQQAAAQAAQAQAQAQQAQAQAQTAQANHTPHMQAANLAQQQLMVQKMMMERQQHMQAQAQGQNGSPMTNRAAMNSSPMTGHAAGNQQQGHGMPMGFQMQNNQAVNSPRPGSAMQMHGTMGQPMARQVSQQQSHPSLSRTGTPQVSMVTPQMANSMPAHSMGTPQRQQLQGSPAMSIQSGNGNNLQAQMSSMNPAQQQQFMQMQAQRREQARQQQVAAQMQNVPAMNGNQMSPQQMAAFQQARQAAQQQANLPPNMMNGNAVNGMAKVANQQAAHQEYRQQLVQQQMQMKNQLAQQQARQSNMNAAAAAGGFPNGMANASNMARGPSQQPFPQQVNQQLPPTPGLQRTQQGQPQPAQNRPQPTPHNPNFPEGAAISQQQVRHAQMTQMVQQKQRFMEMIAGKNNGVLPQNAEQQWQTFLSRREMQKMQAMGQMPQQGQAQGQQQHHNQNQAGLQQQLQQPGFGGAQMTPQQQQNMMMLRQMQPRQGGGQGPQGQVSQAEYIAQVMKQKQRAAALQAQQMGRGLGSMQQGMAQMQQGMNNMMQQNMPLNGMNGMNGTNGMNGMNGMQGMQQRQQGQGRGGG